MTKTIVILSTLASAVSLATPALAGESLEINAPKMQVPETAAPAQPITITGEAVPAQNVTITSEAVPSQNVTVTSEVAPPITRGISLFQVHTGQGLVMAPGAPMGPGLGIGYRGELGNFGVDAGIDLAATDVMHSEKRGFVGSLAKVTAQYYFMPEASHTPYVGAGLSWGIHSGVNVGGASYSGTGLQAEIVGGYEFFRNSNFRLFVQGNVSLPFYRANQDVTSPAPVPVVIPRTATVETADPPASPASRYLPTFGLSLGVAWGK